MRRTKLLAGLAAAAVLLASWSPSVAAAQPAERYAREWSRDSFGAEPLFRPVELLVTSRCEVWVADAGSAVIYRYGCDGRPAWRVGGRGEGPGEFVLPVPMALLRADTIAVLDQRQSRLSLFAVAGRFIGSEPVRLTPGEHGFTRGFGRAGGVTVVHTNNHPTTEPRPNERSAFVWAVQPDGSVSQALLRMPAPQSIIDRSGTASARIDAPFARVPVALFAPDGTLLVGNTGSPVFQRYRYGPRLVPAGRLTLQDLPTLAVTRRERRQWADSIRGQLAEDRARTGLDPAALRAFEERHERMVRGATFPASHPRYLRAAQDERGNLWLQLPSRRGDAEVRWQVRDGSSGRLVRSIQMLPSGRITAAAVRGGRLFTIEVDGDGVARVARYGPSGSR